MIRLPCDNGYEDGGLVVALSCQASPHLCNLVASNYVQFCQTKLATSIQCQNFKCIQSISINQKSCPCPPGRERRSPPCLWPRRPGTPGTSRTTVGRTSEHGEEDHYCFFLLQIIQQQEYELCVVLRFQLDTASPTLHSEVVGDFSVLAK